MTDTVNNIIEIKNLSHGYKNRDGNTLVLYRDVNLSIERQSVMAILGRNGAGKSTLLKSLVGLKHPMSGDIFLDGRRVFDYKPRQLSEHVSFVSTEIINMRNLTVRNVVGLGRAPYTDWIGRLTNEDNAMVDRAIRMVGMGGFENVPIDSVSDGERQRVMIARALAQDTPVVILDEPTAFLDVPNKYEIGLLLRKLAHQYGKTIIFSTHDIDIALRLCDKICLIDMDGFSVGAPEDMVISGRVDSIFAGTAMDFDLESLHIKLNTPLKHTIGLDVEPRYRYLFEKALERVGYAAVDLSEGDSVKVIVKNRVADIFFNEGGEERRFASVGEFLKYLMLKD